MNDVDVKSLIDNYTKHPYELVRGLIVKKRSSYLALETRTETRYTGYDLGNACCVRLHEIRGVRAYVLCTSSYLGGGGVLAGAD